MGCPGAVRGAERNSPSPLPQPGLGPAGQEGAGAWRSPHQPQAQSRHGTTLPCCPFSQSHVTEYVLFLLPSRNHIKMMRRMTPQSNQTRNLKAQTLYSEEVGNRYSLQAPRHRHRLPRAGEASGVLAEGGTSVPRAAAGLREHLQNTFPVCSRLTLRHRGQSCTSRAGVRRLERSVRLQERSR